MMAAATSKGGIEGYLSTTTSKTTRNLQEVFSLLEDPSDSQSQCSILVEGSAGIGKSVLMRQIAYMWANNELLTNTEFLFLLHLRDPSVQQMNSLEALVHYFYHYDELASKVTSCVAQDGGKSVTILLDGYDELPPNLRKNGFIVSLLNRRVLPACSIVVSSRPHISADLRNKISCQVEILGFSEQDQQQFMEHSLEGQPHKIVELKEYLKEHRIISNLCFIPFNMAILLFLYKDKEERPLPTNATELYNLFIFLTICRHLSKSGVTLDEEVIDINRLPQPYSKIVSQLSKFAFKSLGNNQLVFTLAEIKEECPDINEVVNGFGLLQVVEYTRKTSKSLSFNFIHLSIQEFLAAHHVSTLSPSKEFSILKRNFWNNAIYMNMFDFYVGITSGQRRSFKQFLQQRTLVEKFKSLAGRGEDTVGISKHLLQNKFKCLRMYHYFQEVGDLKMCEFIGEATKLNIQQIDLENTRLSASDLECLIVFITSSTHKEWKNVDLLLCHIKDHGLQILQRGLRCSDITITVLQLQYNDLTAVASSAISDLAISYRVKTLQISGNNTVGEDDELYRIITDHSSMVEDLYMSYTKLSSRAAIKLFTAVSEAKKLKTLWINDNEITDEACGAFITAMERNTSLVEINISHNEISEENMQVLIQAVQHNSTTQRLYLNFYYKVNFETAKKIKETNKLEIKLCECKFCYSKMDILYL